MIPKEMNDMPVPTSCEVRAKLVDALRLDLVVSTFSFFSITS